MSIPEHIIIRFFQNTASLEETAELNNWLSEKDENALYFYQLQEIWNSGKQMDDADIVYGWNNIYGKISTNPSNNITSKKFRINRWLRYAAAITIGFIIAGAWYSTNSLLPKTIIHHISFNHPETQRIIFPDSSIAWVSGAGEIVYPEQFQKNIRSVSLKGKAYFDIRKAKQPFVVKSNNMEVEVTGTEFEIEDVDEYTLLTLVSGTVSVKTKTGEGNNVSSIKLTPAQQIKINKITGEFQLFDIDPCYYETWKNGIYRFTDEPIEQIARMLSKHYSVTIHIAPELTGKCFTGRILSHQNINEVMKIIATSHPVRYEITSKDVYITEIKQ